MRFAMKRTFLLRLGTLALLLSLAGCAIVNDNDDADLPDEPGVVVVEEGQRVALPAFETTLRFVEKTEDSRCPANVVCIWEGEVKVLLEAIRSGQGSASFEMIGFVDVDGNDPSGEPGVRHDALGLRFTLERVDPYPLDGIEPTDPVTATIRVETL